MTSAGQTRIFVSIPIDRIIGHKEIGGFAAQIVGMSQSRSPGLLLCDVAFRKASDDFGRGAGGGRIVARNIASGGDPYPVAFGDVIEKAKE